MDDPQITVERAKDAPLRATYRTTTLGDSFLSPHQFDLNIFSEKQGSPGSESQELPVLT